MMGLILKGFVRSHKTTFYVLDISWQAVSQTDRQMESIEKMKGSVLTFGAPYL